MSTDLDKSVMPVFKQTLHCLCEQDWFPQILHPVPRIELQAINELPCDSRVDGHGGRVWPQTLQSLQQISPQRVHLRAMRGNIHLHPTGEDTLTLQLLHQCFERLRIA